MNTNDFELGKLMGQIDALSTKIETNTKSLNKMEACMSESKRTGKEEIIRLGRDIANANKKIHEVSDQLSIYTTAIKIIKTLFFCLMVLVTFKFGDIREVLSGVWK